MKTRVIVAVVLLPLLLAVVLLLPAIWTAVLVSAMSVIAVWELLHETKLAPHIRLILYSMLMAVAVCFWSYFGCPVKWALVGLWVYFVALFCELLAAHAKLQFRTVCVSAFAGVVIPACLSALVRILILPHGKYYIMAAFILAFTADSGAYFAGRAFGKHKLAPVISPKKTVEGALGGILSAVLFMLAYGLVLQLGFELPFRYGFAVLYGVLGSVGSIVGDLTFSVVKRQVGIKDYGKLLPGHGGILDRFDSMVVVAPLTEALILLLPLISVAAA